jgi:uncharacterized protein (TIGR00251 family)
MMLQQFQDAAVLEVKVIPGSRQSEVVGIEESRLKVKLRSPPEGGKANEELIEVLSTFFSIRTHQIKIIKGAFSRFKKVAIALVPSFELLSKLSTLRKEQDEEESELSL